MSDVLPTSGNYSVLDIFFTDPPQGVLQDLITDVRQIGSSLVGLKIRLRHNKSVEVKTQFGAVGLPPSVSDWPSAREEDNGVGQEWWKPPEITWHVSGDERIESETQDKHNVVKCEVIVQSLNVRNEFNLHTLGSKLRSWRDLDATLKLGFKVVQSGAK